jgi:phosphinothricin acetyltransferase
MFELAFAEAHDIPEIVAISNWAAEHTHANFAIEPEPLEDWMQAWTKDHAMYPWLVARSTNGSGPRLLGFAKAMPHKKRGAYAWSADVSVYVHHEAHRRGIGAALYGRLIPLMRAQGYVTLIAGITPPNPGSEGLHRRMGFTQCGTFARVGWKFGRWYDVTYWSLELQPRGDSPRPLRKVSEV